ncbi:MAG: flavin reductase [Christensenellales bacterium]
MKHIKAEDIQKSCFSLIGKDWMLITAQDGKGKVNTMTASWGGMGVLWGRQVAFVFIRPQRYTKQFVDASHSLSLSFFDGDYRKELAYLGKVSGRDCDKIKECNFDVAYDGDVPYISQASLVVSGKVLYAQTLSSDCFFDDKAIEQWYPAKDFHTMYVVGIDSVLIK